MPGGNLTFARQHADTVDRIQACAPEVEGGYLDQALARMRLAAKHRVRVHYGMGRWVIEWCAHPAVPFSPHSVGADGRTHYLRFYNAQAAAQAYANILESFGTFESAPAAAPNPSASPAAGSAGVDTPPSTPVSFSASAP